MSGKDAIVAAVFTMAAVVLFAIQWTPRRWGESNTFIFMAISVMLSAVALLTLHAVGRSP